ncbi:MAG: hypothetical protein ABDH20_13135 [Thermus sp.]
MKRDEILAFGHSLLAPRGPALAAQGGRLGRRGKDLRQLLKKAVRTQGEGHALAARTRTEEERLDLWLAPLKVEEIKLPLDPFLKAMGLPQAPQEWAWAGFWLLPLSTREAQGYTLTWAAQPGALEAFLSKTHAALEVFRALFRLEPGWLSADLHFREGAARVRRWRMGKAEGRTLPLEGWPCGRE